MITNKDIRVENGNLVLNGDKYPLDGQSPETIMDIVEDNSDSTPTENSTAPVTSGGVYTALGTKQDTLTFDNAPTDASTNPVTSGGIYNTIGDLTQTGITGADVATQLGALETAITDVDAYTVSDITDLNQSITVNEFSLRKCGKIVTIGLNFNASDAIAQFTNLFKLPSGIESFGRIDAVGIFATSTPNIARLTVDDNGYVVANSAIAAASYYLGAIVFICDED